MKEVLLTHINQTIKLIKSEYDSLLLKRYTLFWLYINTVLFSITNIIMLPIYIMQIIVIFIIVLIIKSIYNKRVANFIIRKHLL